MNKASSRRRPAPISRALFGSLICAVTFLYESSVLAAERAVQVAKSMGRGINILGYDGIWDGGTDAPFKQHQFKMIREAGFSHVRINFHAFKYMNGQNTVDPQVLARLDWVLEQTVANGLIPVVDEHDFSICQRDPDGCGVKLLAFWRQLSSRYIGRFPTAVFDLLNEPGGHMTQTWWNIFIPQAIRAIRLRNPARTIVVAAINSEDPAQVRKLQLPVHDRNIIVTVHYYKPMTFTHQGAPWSPQFARLRNVEWGSEADAQSLANDFRAVADWAIEEGRPVYLGEFGVYDRADIGARARYVSFVTRTAERLGWPWAYWQFDHDFSAFDQERGRWVRPLLNALIPADRTQK